MPIEYSCEKFNPEAPDTPPFTVLATYCEARYDSPTQGEVEDVRLRLQAPWSDRKCRYGLVERDGGWLKVRGGECRTHF